MLDLLVTKLYIPRLRSGHLSRPELLSMLERGLESRLILVAAAAGSGKTTLLAEWAAQHPGEVCWLSLDETENDPVRFWAYCVAAVQTLYPAFGLALQNALESPQPPSSEATAAAFLNQLATLPNRLIFVLDDYHVITERSIHNALLIDRLPPQLTLVIASRADPPFPLARLRARGELIELRAADLRFSADEARIFLQTLTGAVLPLEIIQAIEARTEGWAAGLQLAALAMGRETPPDFVEQFTGSHRFVLDYLMEEVLARQPNEVRAFLLLNSTLHRLSAPLCDAVTGQADGAAMLDFLERNNLFLVPLDTERRWFRFHHLFGDLLQARLQAENPDLIPELKGRAAHWFAANDFAEEAVVYALDAGEYHFAGTLIKGPAVGASQRGAIETLLSWYQRFPPDVVAADVELCVVFGLAFALNGRWTEALTLERYLQEHPDLPTEATLFLFLTASYQRDQGRLTALATELSAQPNPATGTLLVRGMIGSALGDLHSAAQDMAETQHLAERSGDRTLMLTALFHRCRLHLYMGELNTAAQLCETALAWTEAAQSPLATLAYTALGRICIEQDRLDEAHTFLEKAVLLSKSSGLLAGILSSATLMLAEVAQSRGQSETANDLAEQSLSAAKQFDPPAEWDWLRTYQARLWLTQGNVNAATAWAETVKGNTLPPSFFYPANIQKVTLARVLLAQRQPEKAITLLTGLVQGPPDLLTVECYAILALARQMQADHVHALLSLEQSLTLAEPEHRSRPFLDLGVPMGKLLTHYCEAHPDQPFAIALQDRLDTVRETQIDLLSDRELEILRLIVAGRSNDEIAQTLTLAISTVKWYINVLYGKLHVKTRAQAIALAHDQKLI